MAEAESPEAADATPSKGRSRRALPLVLVVLGSIIGLLAVFAIWAQRQLLETDSWVETSTELLENEDIQEALATYLVDQLYENVDVEREIRRELPPEVKILAGPAAGAVRQVADEVARRALAQERVQALWADANRAAHETLVEVIEGGGDNVSTEGGVVTLDLSSLLGQIADDLGLPGVVAEKLPPEAADLEILRSDELSAAQDAADLLETLAWVLLLLTLALFGVAVYISGDRRRETLRSVGIAFIAIGVIVGLARNAAGNAVVDSLSTSATSEPAVDATWEIATSQLDEAASAAILYGIIIVLSAWLAGPTGLATRARGGLAPYLRQPRFAWGGLALLLVLFFWWSPTSASERFLPSLLLIGFAVLGVEMLRRRTAAEFPDRVATFSPAGMAQTMATQTRESIERRTRARSSRAGADASQSRADALDRLGALKESGVLSDEEFAAEKKRLLGD